jgi:hypothetical protein
VLAFSPLPGLPAPIVLGFVALAALEELELPDDPQPASSASVAQAIVVDRALLIGDRTLA